MELQISNYTKRSFSGVTVTRHNEHDIVFSAGGYSTSAPGAMVVMPDGSMRVELFKEVNEFISRLPKEKQQALYECYARVDSIFQISDFALGGKSKVSDMNAGLKEQVKAIYEIVKFQDLRDYVIGNTKLKLPPGLADDYVTEDKVTPLYKERTYLRKEYIDLLAVAMGLRFMIPIWGAYLPLASKEHATHMMEYHAYQLLYGSSIYQEEPFKRLEVYIRANLKESETMNIGVLLKFLSSEEIPTYLIAISLIRKLSVAPLSAEQDRDHLMKIIFNYALNNNSGVPVSFGVRITKKTQPGEIQDDNSSVLCIYKMKEQISAGDLEMFQYYLQDYQKAAQTIEPEIDPEVVEACVKRALSLEGFIPCRSQIGITIWVLSLVVPGCVIEMFTRKTLMICMGISQAILWKWNLPHLAALLTARKVQLEEDEIMSPVPYKGISPALREQLDMIYPYTLPTSRHSDQISETNPGVKGIEEVVSELFKTYWSPTCSKPLAKAAGANLDNSLEVSTDIRDQFATLFVRLYEYTR